MNKLRNRERSFETYSAPRTCQRLARPKLCHTKVLYGPPTRVSPLKYACCKRRADERWIHRIVQCEADNSMSIQNIAIVFGPTLFGQVTSNGSISGHVNDGMVDAAFQNKVGIRAFSSFSLSLPFPLAPSSSYIPERRLRQFWNTTPIYLWTSRTEGHKLARPAFLSHNPSLFFLLFLILRRRLLPNPVIPLYLHGFIPYYYCFFVSYGHTRVCALLCVFCSHLALSLYFYFYLFPRFPSREV